MKHKSFVFFLILAGILVFLTGCVKDESITGSATLDTTEASPEEVIQSYFTAWDVGDYETMYRHLSDGFKAIEPTAASLEAFESYAEAQQIEAVRIQVIEETMNDGVRAAVSYEVSFLLNGASVPFADSFTLKYREDDIVPGWKMIHPYGDNIDTS